MALFRLRHSVAVFFALVGLLPIGLAIPARLGFEDFSQPWRWRAFDRELLPTKPVSILFRDRSDYVYAGFSEGLFRYNGYRWTKFVDGNDFDGQPLGRIVETANGLYVATTSKVWLLRGRGGLRAVYEGSQFLLAAGPRGGIYLINALDGTHLQLDESGNTSVDGEKSVKLPRLVVNDYVVDDDKIHWLACENGIFSRDISRRSTWKPSKYRSPLSGELSCEKIFLVTSLSLPIPRRPKSSVGDFNAEPRYELWARFRGSGGEPILARRGDDDRWESVADAPRAAFAYLNRDFRGNYYGTTESGELYFSADGDLWRAVPDLGIGGKVRFGLTDRHGFVWFAVDHSESRGGVARFDPESHRWDQLKPSLAPFEDVRIDRPIRSLLEARDGSVWATSEAAVYSFSTDGRVDTHRGHGEAKFTKVTGLVEDDDRILISSQSFDGVCFYRGRRWWKDNDLPSEPLRRIVKDRGGRLWFLPAQPGPDGQHRVFRFRRLFQRPELQEFQVPAGPVNDLVESRNGDYWIATDGGLLRMRVEGTPKKLVLKENVRGLPAKRVWAVAENADDGAIWVCYVSSGVSRILGNEKTHFHEREGIRSPLVWSMVTTSSARGWNVWLGTDRGLTRYDGKCWYNYPVAGLDPQSSQALSLIPSRSDDNAVFVGTAKNGVFRFRLDDHRRPRFVSKLQYEQNPTKPDLWTFSWDARDHKDYTPREDLLFRWSLDSGRWSEFSNLRSAQVPLTPGERHTFRAEVRDLDGNSSRDPETISFFLEPVGPSSAVRSVIIVSVATLAGIVLLALALAVVRRRITPALRYRGAFDGVAAPVIVVDDTGRIVDYNQQRPELLGIEALDGRRPRNLPVVLLPPFQDEQVRKTLETAFRGTPAACSSTFSGHDADRVLAIRALPLKGGASEQVRGAVVVIEDATEETSRLSLAERRERLLAVRRMAESIAGQLEDSIDGLNRDLEAFRGSVENIDLLESIKGRAERVEELSSALSAFAFGETAGKREELSLNGLVESFAETSDNGILRLPRNVKLDLRGQPGLWPISADAQAVRKAFSEILRNSAEAMPRGGKITVRLSNRCLEEGHGQLSPGRYVDVRFGDEGPGMDTNQLAQVFDPLFSTKSRRRHRGLGLSIVYGIVRAHGGDVRIESSSKGTNVSVLLPAAH